MNDKKIEIPDFVELLDAFKEQVNRMDENSIIIYEKVNKIKDVVPKEKKPETEIVKEDGVIGVLWGLVSQMKKHNMTLDEIRHRLVMLVG